MNYFDMAMFDVDENLQKRLGYSRIYSSGKDFIIQETPKHSSARIIIRTRDQNNLIRFMKDGAVCGIIFENFELSKKTIEQAALSRKTIFIPISPLLWHSVWDRQREMQKIKKIVIAAHKLKAKVAIATFAENKESLLSREQLSEISKMIIQTKNSKFSIFGGDIYDN